MRSPLEKVKSIRADQIYSVLRRLAPAIVGIVTVVYSIFSIFETRQQTQQKLSQQVSELAIANDAMKDAYDSRMADLSRLIDERRELLQQEVDGVSGRGGKRLEGTNAEIASLRADIETLRAEVKTFEVALGDDPAKKMGVVILRRDIDSLTEANKSQLIDLKQQMASAHEDSKSNLETVKWLLGAIGISNIVAPLAGALLSSRKSESPSSSSKKD